MRLRMMIALPALLAFALPAAAQVIVWDAPSFMSPRSMDDIGIYVTRTDRRFGGGSATGLSGIWRQSGNLNLGVRAGVGDLDAPGDFVLVGAEFYGPLNRLLPVSQIDLAWVVGAGAVFGDNYTLFNVPFGISIGTRLGSGNVNIIPYVHPRVSLDIAAYDSNGNEQTDTDDSFVLDIGADVNLGQRLILRLGGSLLDREAFGVGLALRWPRPVSVR